MKVILPDPKDPELQLKELQETIRVLSLENETLAERAEDAALLGLIAEKISHLEDPSAVIDTGLEQISLLKDIPVCAYCSSVDDQIRIESSYVSFSETAVESISLVLPKDFTASGSVLLTGDDLQAASLAIGLSGKRYEPTSLLLIPFENACCPAGFFVFADNGRLVHCQALLMRIAEMLTSRISTVQLLRELHKAKADLDIKVEERTRELSDAYRELEQEMAERVTAQENLQDAEAKYRSLTENSRDMIYRMSLPDGVYEYVSPASIAIFGYSPDEFYNTPVLIRKTIHPDWQDYFATQWENLLNSVMPSFYEYQIIQKSGEVRWLNQRNALIKNEIGKPIAIEGVVTDITERKLAEEAVRVSERLLHTIIDAEPECVKLLDENANLISMNRAGLAMLQVDSLDQVKGQCVCPLITSEYRQPFLDLTRRVFQGETGTLLFEMIGMKGRHLWLETHAVPLRDEKDEIYALLGLTRDVTQNKLAESEILRSKQFSESIINSLPGIFYVVDSKGKMVRINERFLKDSGYSQEEVLSMHALDFFSADQKMKVQERIMEVFEKGESSVEADLLSKDGSTIPYYFTGFCAMIDGSPLLVGTGIDITERRNTEKALRDSEEKYRSLFEESQDIVFISTYDGKFVDINPAGVSRLGYASKEELMSVAVRDLYDRAEARTTYLELLNANGFVTDFETTLRRRDKQLLHITMNATALRDDLGNISLIRGIARDVTEHRKLEEQFRQSQKMESIGTLAGGVAHDFNNILTAIIGYGHLTLRKMEKDDPNRLNVEQMLEASDRAAHLTKDLLLFSRKQPIHRKLIDLNEVIRKLQKFLIRVIGEDIALQSVLHENEIPILADAHQIEQVLMNLATNARDAMPKGGALTVTTEQVRLDQQFINLYGYGKPGHYAMVTVSDTGQGMDEQTRQKIFEPFYTTKEVGKGTGLGLAVVYGIVRQHEGYINVDSKPGIGTSFRIYLPVIASGAAEEETTVTEEQPAGGTETILLAEDNESVRELTLSVLKEFGYTVITAIDGKDAVNKYLENKERIQLLLFDLIMPRKSGKEAYEEIRKIKPDIKILFASGYSPDIVRDKASLGKGTSIIFKPVSPMELLKHVRMVLDKGNG